LLLASTSIPIFPWLDESHFLCMSLYLRGCAMVLCLRWLRFPVWNTGKMARHLPLHSIRHWWSLGVALLATFNIKKLIFMPSHLEAVRQGPKLSTDNNKNRYYLKRAGSSPSNAARQSQAFTSFKSNNIYIPRYWWWFPPCGFIPDGRHPIIFYIQKNKKKIF